jgi:hypothetical protein
MKKSYILFVAFSTFLSTALFVGCKHEIPTTEVIGGGGNPPYVNPDPCDPDSVYFENSILPLIASSCAQVGCHDAITHEEGLVLDSYDHIMGEGIITPYDPNDSELLEVLTETGEDLMPPVDNGGPLTADQIDMIALWIAQGAKNNSCIADCDTSLASTFALTVAPIIENSCKGCHSGTSPDGDLLLTNYSEIAAAALDGSLMNSLLALNGATLMPYNSAGLSECQITQIQKWVDAGAPND